MLCCGNKKRISDLKKQNKTLFLPYAVYLTVCTSDPVKWGGAGIGDKKGLMYFCTSRIHTDKDSTIL